MGAWYVIIDELCYNPTGSLLQVTAAEVLPLGIDIGVKDGKIECLGKGLTLGPNTALVDAQGAYVTPG